MKLDTKQEMAIARCTDRKLRTVAVTGPAGSGKTTIMRRVYNALSEQGFKVAVAAPTGKAAKRISEATGLEAQTIHRLLEFSHPGEIDQETGIAVGVSMPRRHASHRLAFNAILCDEYAMVSQEIHQCLIDAMPHNALLRVFGDANQLAPIEDRQSDRERPSAFMRLLNDFDGIRLDTIHRQGEGSGISSNGYRILQGRTPARTDDFYFKLTPNLQDQLFEIIIDHGKRGYGYDTLQNQIITPANKGKLGTKTLNPAIQQMMLSHRDGVPSSIDMPRWSVEDKKLRMYVGDKVICTSNNYDLAIFNGETGIIVETDRNHGTLSIDFGDRVVEIPPIIPVYKADGSLRYYDPRKSFDLAYIVSTHKAQGSEYKSVIYVMSPGCGRLRSQRNFYTGVTRARELCTVVSDAQSWNYALWNTNDSFS